MRLGEHKSTQQGRAQPQENTFDTGPGIHAPQLWKGQGQGPRPKHRFHRAGWDGFLVAGPVVAGEVLLHQKAFSHKAKPARTC